LNFSSVELLFAYLFALFYVVQSSPGVLKLDFGSVKSRERHFPDLVSCFVIELIETQLQMDSRAKGLIDNANTVRRKEKDSFEVVQSA